MLFLVFLVFLGSWKLPYIYIFFLGGGGVFLGGDGLRRSRVSCCSYFVLKKDGDKKKGKYLGYSYETLKSSICRFLWHFCSARLQNFSTLVHTSLLIFSTRNAVFEGIVIKTHDAKHLCQVMQVCNG